MLAPLSPKREGEKDNLRLDDFRFQIEFFD